MQLKQISRILVQFSPWTGEGKSAREFLARITSATAKKSNPACQVITRVRVKGDSFVEIEYENKSVERIATGNKTVSQILETVQNKAEEMDTQQKLKEAGLQGQKIETAWLKELGKETESGFRKFIPRQQ